MTYPLSLPTTAGRVLRSRFSGEASGLSMTGPTSVLPQSRGGGWFPPKEVSYGGGAGLWFCHRHAPGHSPGGWRVL